MRSGSRRASSTLDHEHDRNASHFFDNKLKLGVVGYYLQQVIDDFGAPPALDGFRSRIAGVSFSRLQNDRLWHF
jgi:hypothetical protein